MQEAPKEVYQMFAGLLRGLEKDSRQAEEKAAKKDPLKHKMSRVLEDASYRYYDGGKDRRGTRVLFCWSTHRNVAGFYLGWREVCFKSGKVKRDRWLSRRIRKRCKDIALRRRDAFKEKHAKPVPASV